MAEKTEQPTPKRLRDAREKGQVCKSQDVSSASITAAMFLLIAFCFPVFRVRLEHLMEASFTVVNHNNFDAAIDLMRSLGLDVFIVIGMLPPVVAAVVGVVANLCQVGFLASFESVNPKLDKLSPANWFKNVFSKKNLLEFIKGLVKIVLLCVIFHSCIKAHLGNITAMPLAGFEGIMAVTSYVLWDIAKMVIGLFLGVAAIDYLLQSKLYMDDMMMSFEDIKNEYKEMEGDPIVKSQRKQMHQDLIFGEEEAVMDKSTVVVTNPSHYAVALRYVKDETPLPIIMKKGMDGGAVRIMRMAERRGIPIYRNVPLARSLYALGDEFEYIPSELIEAAAEVIRWLRDQYPLEFE